MIAVAVVCTPGSASAQSDEVERVRDAATVFEEVMGVPDQAIPTAILQKAEAVAVFPNTIKGGLGIGAHRGRGILSVRNPATGAWSSPGFLTLTGGSFGLQIGAQAIDLVLVVMNRRGLDNLLRNEFKIGADASVAAGPVGRGAEASTDIQLRAEILSYSRARGLFAGVSLVGSAIREDEDAIKSFYGQARTNREIVEMAKPVAAASEPEQAAGAWRDVIGKHTK
jgi:lipid-binding SYLF domain-containing protein